ncbi:hypothetical protein DESC_610256 [Desulfosarcina cetonica]|nr:hypothetical protein DESC_610256 [Desulfosarcina cetonica]
MHAGRMTQRYIHGITFELLDLYPGGIRRRSLRGVELSNFYHRKLITLWYTCHNVI